MKEKVIFKNVVCQSLYQTGKCHFPPQEKKKKRKRMVRKVIKDVYAYREFESDWFVSSKHHSAQSSKLKHIPTQRILETELHYAYMNKYQITIREKTKQLMIHTF